MRAPSKTISKAKSLRRTMTPPEARLWLRLKAFRAHGLQFRKQHPIGPYVVDFYCSRLRLAVEVDGLIHDIEDRVERDLRRDAWLGEQGVTVIRVPARDVLRDADEVAEMIWRNIHG